MIDAFICDAVRTPFRRHGAKRSSVRPDDLAGRVMRTLTVDWTEVDDVILDCANQGGKDNHNIARMAGQFAAG